MNEMNANLEEIFVGDQVLLIDNMTSGDTWRISAKVIEIRRILGEQTYMVETENGKRKLVSESQINKIGYLK